MQELHHRMQNLERQLADQEHRQQISDPDYSQSPKSQGRTSYRSSRSRRTSVPRSGSSRENIEHPRRRNNIIIYARGKRAGVMRRERENREERSRGTRRPIIMGATPFHRSILEVRLPKHFDKPTDMRYDRTQDPQEHLTDFEARMNLEGVGDEVRSHTFPVTLAGPAIRWFNSLPQGSVASFSDISRAFLAQFTTRIVKAKHPINLLDVTQKANETTRKYLDRFNDECLEIEGLTDSMASLYLTNGLLNEDFRKHLTTKPVWTMQEIQTVAREYINDEEVSRVVAANKQQPSYTQPRQHGNGERQKEHAKDDGPSKTHRPFPCVGKFTNYTPLTLPIIDVYQQIAEKKILSKPRPLKDWTGGNKSLYCDYHKGYGHKTQDCFDLKDALEQAIRDGKLVEFSHLIKESRRRGRDQDGEDKSRTAKRRQEPRDGDHGLTIVNVVTARNTAPRSRSAYRKEAKVLAISSSSSSQSSKRAPSISFGQEDRWFDEILENPPMVITTRDADLTTHQHGVVGLDDHFIKPDRIISLPVSIGREQGRRSVMAEFVVLRDSTAYNIILGRKTINDVGAIISTKLLVMKFVTDNGSVRSIKGELETMVACDNASLSLRKKSKEVSGVFLADLDARVDDNPR
ncbi:uncharacterized protein [Arachis hypogaea]|uniref:uncharacterized protein n=1 Tax=Arachis hypogaea TaxID=3818 RepID=UPI000DEC9372|nr:uncharacterized protein LOC112762495 [Arachis hypogaea]